MSDSKQQKFYALQEEFLVVTSENITDVGHNESERDDSDRITDHKILNALRNSGL